MCYAQDTGLLLKFQYHSQGRAWSHFDYTHHMHSWHLNLHLKLPGWIKMHFESRAILLAPASTSGQVKPFR
jgi:hypothetical protein